MLAGYHGLKFWVFDVCASVLFAQMAEQAAVAREYGWLGGGRGARVAG